MRKRRETPAQKDSPNQRHRFISVKDSRNRKVRGLWLRNGIYYIQFWVAGETSLVAKVYGHLADSHK